MSDDLPYVLPVSERRQGPTYRVTFDDTSSVVVDASAIWTISARNGHADAFITKTVKTDETADNYRRCYENYVRPRWAHTPISNVRYDDVATWITTLKGRDGLPAGVTTRREIALYFGRLMGHAVKKRLLANNPAKGPLGQTDYVPAKEKQREHVYLTMPQLTALAASCGEFELFVMLAGTCGLR